MTITHLGHNCIVILETTLIKGHPPYNVHVHIIYWPKLHSPMVAAIEGPLYTKCDTYTLN